MEYQPLRVAIVSYRLEGKEIPKVIDLARKFPCKECGAPVDYACKETSALCWRARLLTEKQWTVVREARKIGLGAAGGFKDEIYHGLNCMGIAAAFSDHDGVHKCVREWKADEIVMVKFILDKVHVSDFDPAPLHK